MTQEWLTQALIASLLYAIGIAYKYHSHHHHNSHHSALSCHYKIILILIHSFNNRRCADEKDSVGNDKLQWNAPPASSSTPVRDALQHTILEGHSILGSAGDWCDVHDVDHSCDSDGRVSVSEFSTQWGQWGSSGGGHWLVPRRGLLHRRDAGHGGGLPLQSIGGHICLPLLLHVQLVNVHIGAVEIKSAVCDTCCKCSRVWRVWSNDWVLPHGCLSGHILQWYCIMIFDSIDDQKW